MSEPHENPNAKHGVSPVTAILRVTGVLIAAVAVWAAWTCFIFPSPSSRCIYCKLKGGCGPREPKVFTNLHVFQIAVERHAVGHGGKYPSNLEALLKEGSLNSWPTNPFENRGVKVMPWGSPGVGDISYWVNEKRDDYCLVAYGYRFENGARSVKVVIRLVSGRDRHSIADTEKDAPFDCKEPKNKASGDAK